MLQVSGVIKLMRLVRAEDDEVTCNKVVPERHSPSFHTLNVLYGATHDEWIRAPMQRILSDRCTHCSAFQGRHSFIWTSDHDKLEVIADHESAHQQA